MAVDRNSLYTGRMSEPAPVAQVIRALTSDRHIRFSALDASPLWDGVRRGCFLGAAPRIGSGLMRLRHEDVADVEKGTESRGVTPLIGHRHQHFDLAGDLQVAADPLWPAVRGLPTRKLGGVVGWTR